MYMYLCSFLCVSIIIHGSRSTVFVIVKGDVLVVLGDSQVNFLKRIRFIGTYR
jgi:hypothetical protein